MTQPFQNELNCLDILSGYPHIRYVYLSANQLEDLSPLGSMKYMLSLDCNRNKVEKLNIQPMEYLQVRFVICEGVILNFLQILDLSYNKVNTFEGLQHPRLKTLNLNSNRITNLDSMKTISFNNLEVLELRSNGIETLTVWKLII